MHSLFGDVIERECVRLIQVVIVVRPTVTPPAQFHRSLMSIINSSNAPGYTHPRTPPADGLSKIERIPGRNRAVMSLSCQASHLPCYFSQSPGALAAGHGGGLGCSVLTDCCYSARFIRRVVVSRCRDCRVPSWPFPSANGELSLGAAWQAEDFIVVTWFVTWRALTSRLLVLDEWEYFLAKQVLN